MTEYVLPLITAFILVFAFVKKVKVFDCFVDGAKKGFSTAVSLLPALVALMLCVSLLSASGGTDIITKLLSPIFSVIGVPEEIIPLCVISPVSGSGSLSVYEKILTEYGADSYVGRVASVISGATETTFYALTVYFGSVGIKNYSAVIPCALLGDFVSFAAAAFTVRLFFA